VPTISVSKSHKIYPSDYGLDAYFLDPFKHKKHRCPQCEGKVVAPAQLIDGLVYYYCGFVDCRPADPWEDDIEYQRQQVQKLLAIG